MDTPVKMTQSTAVAARVPRASGRRYDIKVTMLLHATSDDQYRREMEEGRLMMNVDVGSKT